MSANHSVLRICPDQIKFSVNDVIVTRLGKSGMYEEMATVPFNCPVANFVANGDLVPWSVTGAYSIQQISGYVCRFGTERILSVNPAYARLATSATNQFVLHIALSPEDIPTSVQTCIINLRYNVSQAADIANPTAALGAAGAYRIASCTLLPTATGMVMNILPITFPADLGTSSTGYWPTGDGTLQAGFDTLNFSYQSNGLAQ